MNLLNEKPVIIKERFLDEYNQICPIDKDKWRRNLKDKTSVYDILTEQWYKDYSYEVYNHEDYFIDLMDCYLTYSRRYIKAISKLNLKIKSFIDVGCGIGYSTLALKELYPDAVAYGTNLKGTKQWSFCERLPFNLIENIKDIGHVDLVFASEYFEHFKDPIGELIDIMYATSPKYFVIANTFNQRSPGHFNYYYKENKLNMGKLFSDSLKLEGYTQIETRFWNNRPMVWTNESN